MAAVPELYAGDEAGRPPRIRVSLAATVTYVNKEGVRTGCPAVVDNLSRGGLYLRLRADIALGTGISFVIQLLESRGAKLRGAGTVLRVEPKPDGTNGVAVQRYLS